MLTVDSTATETAMMAITGLAQGQRQSPINVAKGVGAMESGSVEVVRTDEQRRELAVFNRADPAAADARSRP